MDKLWVLKLKNCVCFLMLQGPEYEGNIMYIYMYNL